MAMTKDDLFRALRRKQAAANAKAKAGTGLCTRAYCYRTPWGPRALCRKHTLLVRAAMQRYRDSGKANLTRWRREMKRP
jgi:hypothetical protein